jgi:hypothetical protein
VLSVGPQVIPPADYTFIHTVVCLTTGPQPLPKRVLHTVRASASSVNFCTHIEINKYDS